MSSKLQSSAPATLLALSPDGTRLAIAAADGSAQLVHLQPGEQMVRAVMPLEPGRQLKALVFDPGGVRLAAIGHDGSATLWSSRTGARMTDLSAAQPVELVTFSGDGRWLATAHRDGTVRCWQAGSGREVFALPTSGLVEALVFSPSSRRLLTIAVASAEAHLMQAWDLHGGTGRLVASQEVPTRQPLIIHASGRWLAYADERLVHIWDIEMLKEITALYVDFDDPDVPADGWELFPPQGGGGSSAVAKDAPVRLTRAPYLAIVSALETGALKRAVQVLDGEHIYQADMVLDARRLVTSRHHVEGPSYTEVDISVSAVRRTLEMSPAKVEDSIRNALSGFFDPLHGGPDGKGWPLGRAVYASEVYQVVEGVPAVDHVEDLALNQVSAGQQARVDIAPRSLVKCTIHARVV